MHTLLARIQRGATKSRVAARQHLTSQAQRLRAGASRRPDLRHAVVILTAARVAFAPVPVAASPATVAHADADLPPSTQVQVAFSPTAAATLTVVTPTLPEVTPGKSNATVQAEAEAAEAERQRQEALQKAAAQAAAEAAAKAAQAKAAQEAAVRQAAAQYAPSDLQQQLRSAAAAAFGDDQVDAFMSIVRVESGFNPSAYNARSGACGLFQALPCSKMGGMAVDHQVSWGIGYIRARYGTPKNAWAFHLIHGYY